MEEKKLDINSLIGFLLIGAILLYMLWQNQPTPEQLAAEQQAKEVQIDDSSNQKPENNILENIQNTSNDQQKSRLGAFAYSLEIPSATENFTILENDVLVLKINNKGGGISEAKLKTFVNYDSVPVYLINDKTARFNLSLSTSDNRTLNTSDLYFEHTI